MQLSFRRYSSLAIALGLIACASSVQAPIASASASKCATSGTTGATTTSAKTASTAACLPFTGSVPKGTLVQLDGSLSNDPQKRPLTFNWTIDQQPPGSTA